MKKRPVQPDTESRRAERFLCEALLNLRTVEEAEAFLEDLCTPAERESLRDRWRVVPLLVNGDPYWKIHEMTGVSITTIGRVARSLEHGAGGYALVAERLPKSRAKRSTSQGGTKTRSGAAARSGS